MRFRGITLPMHHGANINKVESDVDAYNAALNANEFEDEWNETAMDGEQSDGVDTAGNETDNLVDSEGIVYPAGARGGVE